MNALPVAALLSLPLLRALLLACALLALPAWSQVLQMERALAVASDSSRFPQDSAAAADVMLPDDWARSRPEFTGAVWYRVAFDAPNMRASGALLGLHVARACSNIEIYLNGQLMHRRGRLAEPVTQGCSEPLLVALPAALLREHANLLDLRLVGHARAQVASAQRAGGLSVLRLGPYLELDAEQQRAHAWQIALPRAVSTLLAGLGVLLLCLALTRPQRSATLLGMLSLCWALIVARQWWRDLPLPTYDAELLLVTLVAIAVLIAVRLLLRASGRAPPALDAALVAQSVIVPLTLLLGGPQRIAALAAGWYALLALESSAALLFAAARAWRRGNGADASLLALLLPALLVPALWLFAQQRALAPLPAAAAALLLPLLLVGATVRLLALRDGAAPPPAPQAPATATATLDEQVREATADLERRYAQLAELQVEQVTQRERKRIAADLHDDLGAKLLAREALEEMRLSVRGLTGKPVRLVDALGDWRAEVVARLNQTGIEGEWSAPADEPVHTLNARAYVQTTRILRESVSNVIKHSGATRCSVRCAIRDDHFQLVIQDNGRGIPLELDGRLDRGHGMTSMKQRAKQLQGQCLVESGPGYGTVIRLTVPLETPPTAM